MHPLSSHHDEREPAGTIAPASAAFPLQWLPHLEGLPFYRQLSPRQRRHLRIRTAALVRRWRWRGVDLEVTDEMRVVIAAQAALLLLGLPETDYDSVHTVVVHRRHYPSAVVSTDPARGATRVLRHSQGELRPDGEIHLAWDAVRRGADDPHDGHNLVLHEFAHALDLLDGRADGRPPLPDAHERSQWARHWNAALEHLRRDAAHGIPTLLDRYGAESRAELFAVATECFFERGPDLVRRHPDLYELLWRYYGQDPAGRAEG